MDNLNTIYKYCLDKYLNCDIYVKELTEERRVSMKTIAFPSGFWWGCSSGPQTEGLVPIKAHENVMVMFGFRTDPEDFFNNESWMWQWFLSHAVSWVFVWWRRLDSNSFRTSIQWSRLIKDFRNGWSWSKGYGVTQRCYWRSEEKAILNLYWIYIISICQLVLQIWRLGNKHVVDYSWSLPRLRSNVLAMNSLLDNFQWANGHSRRIYAFHYRT